MFHQMKLEVNINPYRTNSFFFKKKNIKLFPHPIQTWVSQKSSFKDWPVLFHIRPSFIIKLKMHFKHLMNIGLYFAVSDKPLALSHHL